MKQQGEGDGRKWGEGAEVTGSVPREGRGGREGEGDPNTVVVWRAGYVAKTTHSLPLKTPHES